MKTGLKNVCGEKGKKKWKKCKLSESNRTRNRFGRVLHISTIGAHSNIGNNADFFLKKSKGIVDRFIL